MNHPRSSRLATLAWPALAAALVFAAFLLAEPGLAARGTSTAEERERAMRVVEILETAPASAEAAEGRTWLLGFLSEVPDITAKQCHSLLGTAAERAGMRPELLAQPLFSGAAQVIRDPSAGAGSTETLTAALAGTLRAYRAWKAADPSVVHTRLEQLVSLEAEGGLVSYVRGAGRNCI